MRFFYQLSTSGKILCASISMLSLFFGITSLSAQRYSDAASDLGVAHTMNSSDGFGAGASFFDFDGDGWDDITLVCEFDSLYLFRNTGGAFERIHLYGTIDAKIRQALWVDYDNDGENDLFVSTKDGGVRLLRNTGGLVLEDVTAQSGLAGLNTSNYGVSFADYDRDGDLDFFLARYLPFGDPNNHLQVCALYRNNGDGTFANVTETAGVASTSELSFMGGWMDYNRDGWPDLMVINDKLIHHNHLYMNNGDGTFTEVTDETGAEMPLTDAMSATFADFDNDMDLDFYSTSTHNPTTHPKLLVNQGGEYFTEEAEDRGLNFNKWCWGSAFFDANNDSNLDFYIASGWTGGHWNPEERSGYFQNNADHTFTDRTADEFADETVAASYGVAIGDANNDGYPEILSLNAKEFNSFLWLNAGGNNNYIKVSLSGTVSNAMAVGSWIDVFADGASYTHYTRCGEGYCSQNSQHHIFGLNDATLVDSVTVWYPSGHTDTYYNLGVNQHYFFSEGETFTAELDTSGSVSLCEGETLTVDAGIHNSYLWSTGDTAQTVEITEPGNYFVQVWNASGISATSDTVSVQFLPPTEVEILTTGVSCAGAADGSIALVVPEGSLHSLLWSTADSTENLANLQAGIYSFSALDANGCLVTGETSINGPAPLLGQAITTDALCFGEANGSVILNLLGGTTPYFPDWQGMDPEALHLGNYMVTVFDANDCTAEISFSIGAPDSLQIELFAQDAFNGNSNGSAGISVSGGTPPYSINWSNGIADSLWVDGLAPGGYGVTVTDDHGCEVTKFFTIGTNTAVGSLESAGLTIFPNPAVGHVNIEHNRGSIGAIEVYDSAGKRVLYLERSSDRTSLDISNLPPGIYHLRFPSLTGAPQAKIAIR